jgi:polyisoprenoid-binding protein YceI
MKRIFLFTLSIAATLTTAAQNYFTKNGAISFFSKTSMENIDAVNNQAVSVINSKTGDIKFSVNNVGFLFKKALMQEHFNENYIESAKYPKSTFSGKIADITKVKFTTDGTYPVTVSGSLTMHGVTKTVSSTGNITVKSGKVSAASTFKVLLADYNIDIPKVVEGNISKTIEIKVNCDYTLQK